MLSKYFNIINVYEYVDIIIISKKIKFILEHIFPFFLIVWEMYNFINKLILLFLKENVKNDISKCVTDNPSYLA